MTTTDKPASTGTNDEPTVHVQSAAPAVLKIHEWEDLERALGAAKGSLLGVIQEIFESTSARAVERVSREPGMRHRVRRFGTKGADSQQRPDAALAEEAAAILNAASLPTSRKTELALQFLDARNHVQFLEGLRHLLKANYSQGSPVYLSRYIREQIVVAPNSAEYSGVRPNLRQAIARVLSGTVPAWVTDVRGGLLLIAAHPLVEQLLSVRVEGRCLIAPDFLEELMPRLENPYEVVLILGVLSAEIQQFWEDTHDRAALNRLNTFRRWLREEVEGNLPEVRRQISSVIRDGTLDATADKVRALLNDAVDAVLAPSKASWPVYSPDPFATMRFVLRSATGAGLSTAWLKQSIAIAGGPGVPPDVYYVVFQPEDALVQARERERNANALLRQTEEMMRTSELICGWVLESATQEVTAWSPLMRSMLGMSGEPRLCIVSEDIDRRMEERLANYWEAAITATALAEIASRENKAAPDRTLQAVRAHRERIHRRLRDEPDTLVEARAQCAAVVPYTSESPTAEVLTRCLEAILRDEGSLEIPSNNNAVWNNMRITVKNHKSLPWNTTARFLKFIRPVPGAVPPLGLECEWRPVPGEEGAGANALISRILNSRA